MAYHLKEIKKGKVGEFSKIKEEIDELLDAQEQGDNILMLCELCDLIGAIELFTLNKYNISIDDLKKFSDKTRAAFVEGKRR